MTVVHKSKMRRLITAGVLLCSTALSVSAAGCKTHYIGNTTVEDTEQNRDVIDFVETYRKAVERRHVGKLSSMAHERYYEDGGNVDASDDIDHGGLERHLEEQFSQAKDVRYEVRYRRIGPGRGDTIQVDYTYTASFKIPTDKGDVWRRVVQDNRLVLLPEGETFKILRGM